MVDAKDDLVTFLRNNFDSNQISISFTNNDDIVHADYDGALTWPQVAVVTNDPVVPGGGTTQATGIDPSGGGPIQDRIHVIQVDCWGGPEDDSAYASSGTHPDEVAVELSDEVFETCFLGEDGVPSGYEWITADAPFEADDTESETTRHRMIVNVRLKETHTP